jgi:hypothetical protein
MAGLSVWLGSPLPSYITQQQQQQEKKTKIENF